MPNKLFKRISICSLLFALIWLPLSSALFPQSARADHTEDTGWGDYENYTVIDHNTVWSGSMTAVGVDKPVVVVNGATLTIEKGSQIEWGLLSVYDGQIVAVGTEMEP